MLSLKRPRRSLGQRLEKVEELEALCRSGSLCEELTFQSVECTQKEKATLAVKNTSLGDVATFIVSGPYLHRGRVGELR